MSDERLLPDWFLESYRRALGADPPVEFLEAYEVLVDAYYFGTALEPEQRTGGGRPGFERGIDFRGAPLGRTKDAVDRRLARMARNLRRWAEPRQGPAARRGVPARGRARDLGESRGARDLRANRET